ncbi:MAG: BREX-1 system phosphatase PglZ type B, partial [Planctomycetota bacterium]
MSKAARTVLDALVQHLRACASTADGLAAPAAILWTDPEGQWRSLAPAMLQALPELLVFGAFDPAQRTGPAIWLRCMVDRTLPEPALPADRVPIVYLPGVSRQGLSTGEECQRELQPLVELMFRGVLWLQKGGHDWTVSAFLTSPQALGLDVARDAATRSAMLNSLRELAMATVAQLQRGRLEANDFYQLLTTDPTRDLLRWMSEPDATKGRMESDRWSAFCALCRERFGLDPDRDGVVKAGGLLGEAEGPWADVWTRYEEAPASYAGIPELLRKCRPSMLQQSHWPQRNDKEEQQLGEALRKLAGQAHAELCAAVLELDRAHAPRRQWVWSRLQQAPLAGVIERLAAVAGKVQRPLGGSAPDEIAQAYANGVWRADAAAWQALAVTPVQHEEVVRQVVQALLAPWAADSAQAFQAAVARMPTLARRDDVVEAKEGGCLMFVDGLRYDLGCLLDVRMAGRGCRTEMRRRWAALPTVTATGKPAVTPVGGDVTGQRLGEDFAPSFRSGRGIDAAALRTAIANKGYQLVGSEGGYCQDRSDALGFHEILNVASLGLERHE